MKNTMGIRPFFYIGLVIFTLLVLFQSIDSVGEDDWSEPDVVFPHLGGVRSLDAASGDDGLFHIVYLTETNWTQVAYFALDRNGSVSRGPIDISQGAYEFPPSISVGPDGNVHIVCGSPEGHDGFGIQYVSIGPNGSILQRSFIADNVSSLGNGAIAVGENGDIYIVWSSSWDDIRYTSLLPDGTVNISDKRITYDAFRYDSPSLVVDPANMLHVVWIGIGASPSGEIYYQRFEPSGTPISEITNLSSLDTDRCYYLDIAEVGTTGFVLIWNEYPSVSWSNPVYPSSIMMELTFDGTSDGPTRLSPREKGLGVPRATAIPDGGAFITWGTIQTNVNRGYLRRIQPGFSEEARIFMEWSDSLSKATPISSFPAVFAEERFVILFQGALGEYPYVSSSLYVTMHAALRPDMTFMEGTSIAPEHPSTGQIVLIELSVVNQGPAQASNVNVDVYLDDTTGATTMLGTIRIPNVQTNEKKDVNWTWLATTGDSVLRFVISGCEPSEDILWNNTMEIHFDDINAPPIIQISSPPSLSALGGMVVVSGLAWDLDWDPLSYQYRIDDGEWTPFDGSMEWNLSFDSNVLTDEMHSIGVRCWDGQNHSNVDVLDFFVNNAMDDPDQTFLIVGTWPSNKITINTVTEIEFSVTTWTYFNKVITYEWSMNETVVAVDTSIFTLNSSYYANGSYTLTISCSDGEQELEHEWDLIIEVPPAGTIPPDDPVNENEPPTPYWALIAVVVIIVIGSLSFFSWKRNST